MPTKSNQPKSNFIKFSRRKVRKQKEFGPRMVQVSDDFVGIFGSKSLRAPAVPFGLEKALTGVFGNSGRACLGLLALFLANFAFCHTTFAESVSISVSNTSETFALAPGSSSVFGKSNDITASITTDYPYGYEFTVAGPNDEQKLKSTNSHLLSISSVATENDFKTGASTTYDNKWGFLPSKLNSTSNTEYQPSPKKTTPTPIDVTLSANPDTANNYTFAIAARVDNTVPKETYSSDFTLAAVANYAYFGIGFADVSNGIPAIIHGLTNNGNVTFTAPATPTKTGYTFKGWCSVETGDNGSCNNGTTYEAGTEYTISLSSNFINTYTTLYARWEPIATFESVFQEYGKSKYNGTNYYAMQDMNPGICSAVSVTGEESVTQLIDTRDNNIYSVGKMVDGKCWLLDNLRLTNESEELSSANTNVPADWQENGGFGFPEANNPYKLPPSGTSCFTPNACSNNGMGNDEDTGYTGYTVPTTNTENIDYTNTEDEIVAASNWKTGVYYNFATASAGTARTAAGIDPGDAQYDICPKGWRMPTGGPNGEYQGLSIALGGKYLPRFDENGDVRQSGYVGPWARIELRNALHLPLSGFIGDNGSIREVGVRSYFWSSTTVGDGTTAYFLFASVGNVAPQNTDVRRHGFTVRCVAK